MYTNYTRSRLENLYKSHRICFTFSDVFCNSNPVILRALISGFEASRLDNQTGLGGLSLICHNKEELKRAKKVLDERKTRTDLEIVLRSGSPVDLPLVSGEDQNLILIRVTRYSEFCVSMNYLRNRSVWLFFLGHLKFASGFLHEIPDGSVGFSSSGDLAKIDKHFGGKNVMVKF